MASKLCKNQQMSTIIGCKTRFKKLFNLSMVGPVGPSRCPGHLDLLKTLMGKRACRQRDELGICRICSRVLEACYIMAQCFGAHTGSARYSHV